ncbi:MFS transporter [Candidatus Woesearchaeota archaeon]|nr:MFS transporter [Candidatus Woesearchaeota archaeon]
MPLKKYYFQLKNKLYMEGGFSYANFTLLNGAFLIGFALALGANNLELGIILAIPLFTNLLQLFSAFMLEVTGTKKKTAILSLFFGRALWILIVLMAFELFGNGKNIFLLMAILLLSSLFSSIGNLALLSWMKDIVPLERLARFFGKRNMYATASGIFAYLLGSYMLDKYRSLKTYGYLFFFALIFGLIALLYLINIPDSRKKIKAISPKKFFERLSKPLNDKNFKQFLRFGLLWGFAINVASPFFLVYMLKDLSLGFFVVSLFLIIDALARIYGLGVWRKIADSFGAKPLLVISTTVTSAVPLAFLFIDKGNYFLIMPIFIVAAISYASVDISLGQLLFKSAPKKYDAYYLAAFSSLTGLASSFGPIFGGIIASLIGNGFSVNFFPPLKYVFLASFILRVMCIPLVSKLYEPEAKNVNDTLDRMKTLKTVSFFVSIYSFTSYASKIVLIPQKQFFILQRKLKKRKTKKMRV